MQTRDGVWRFELCPNRSRSWPQTRRLLIVIAMFHGLIAVLFAWQGLRLVAPFRGLEVAAVWTGLYCCSRATYRRELIVVQDARVVVQRGRQRLESPDEVGRAWARLRRQLARQRGRSCLQLGSHGRFSKSVLSSSRRSAGSWRAIWAVCSDSRWACWRPRRHWAAD
ncbi:DUF2244 domain-containing protein [Immundisolibacter sp.]